MVMVADFQIANQEQKTFLKEIKKKFLLRISTRLRILDPNLQTLVHKQFASPKYVEMWKYSWFKAGYLDEHPQEFLNPVRLLFWQKIWFGKMFFL